MATSPAPRVHCRCPTCGKVSQEQNFAPIDHELQVLTQFFVGGGNRGWRDGSGADVRAERKATGEKGAGFRWERRTVNRAELAKLAEAAQYAADRLTRLLTIVDLIADEDEDVRSVVRESAKQMADDGASPDQITQMRDDVLAILNSEIKNPSR